MQEVDELKGFEPLQGVKNKTENLDYNKRFMQAMQNRCKVWRLKHGDKPPPVFMGTDGRLFWANNKKRKKIKQINKEKGFK